MFDMRKYVTLGRFEIHLVFIVLALTVLLLSTALAITYFTKTIDHQAAIGTDGNIQAYSDAPCTQIVNSHDWGSFNTTAGDDSKSTDIYVKNLGNVAANVTWYASQFSSYNSTSVEYGSASWSFYMARVSGGEFSVRPENDTTPDKINLTPGQVVHFRFHLTALDGSAPETLDFLTSFMSKST